MNASLIQEFPKLESREKSRRAKQDTAADTDESFREQLDCELLHLAAHPRVEGVNQGDEPWFAPTGALSHPSKPSEPSLAQVTGQVPGSPKTPARGISEPFADRGQAASSFEAAKATNKADPQGSHAKTDATRQSTGGKNDSAADGNQQEGAKIAPRPVASSTAPLTSGAVKSVENALASASSAASAAAQAVPVYHGTPHASGANRSGNVSLQQATQDQAAMTAQVGKNQSQAKGESLPEGQRAASVATVTRVAGVETSSSGSSSTGGGFDPAHQFGRQDFGGEWQVHSSAKSSIAATQAIATVDSIRKIQSMIQEQAIVMKQSPGQPMQVLVRPDANMALYLTLQQHESDVMVAVRMDQATSGLLKPHWAELQKELGQQGIQLGDPELDSDHGMSGGNADTDQETGTPSNSMHPQGSPLKTSAAGLAAEPSEGVEEERAEGSLLSWA
ncbi:MAG: hypothetical protein P8L18_09370 [Verrucomicrobiota bacterium]|nr:hypothetical protein [Verrucomicrobiota bacterium]